MNTVNFADIFFILLVCCIIFAILRLVNRGKKTVAKKKAKAPDVDNKKKQGIPAEDD